LKRRGGVSRPSVIFLAADAGASLRSSVPALLHRIGGRTLLEAMLETAEELSPARIVVVAGPARRGIEETVEGRPVTVVAQDTRGGTLAAARRAFAALIRPRGPVFVVTGQLPLLRIETLRSLADRQGRGSLDLAFLSFRPPDGAGFAPVARDASGNVTAIAAANVSPASEEAVPEVDAGVYCFAPRALEEVLARLRGAASTRAGLTGAVAVLAARPGKVEAVEAEDWREAWSIRTRRDLAAAEEIGRRRAVDRALDRGATIVDPNSTRIGPLVELEPDVVIYPFVSLEGRSVLREGCEVHSFTRVADSVLGPRVVVFPHCDIEGAAIGSRCRVGPFARLRPGTVLEEDVRVGNFVETKVALLRRGVKALHLSYLGDAEIGADTNIGAGVITCNYDGEKKHRTTIGRGAFIGSDSQLVAPVTVGDGAYVGAGSTITKDVPADALALTRVPQKNIAGWAVRRRKRRTGRRGDGGTG